MLMPTPLPALQSPILRRLLALAAPGKERVLVGLVAPLPSPTGNSSSSSSNVSSSSSSMTQTSSSFLESQEGVLALVGCVGVVVLVVGVVLGVVLARRWASRKADQERQQILIWPGAGTQPCSFQTKEIRFTLPPTISPPNGTPEPPESLQSFPVGGVLGSSDGSIGGERGERGGGGGGGGRGSLPGGIGLGNVGGGPATGKGVLNEVFGISSSDVASPSSSSLASFGSGETAGSGGSCSTFALSSLSDVRRASLTEHRRRSLPGYSLGTLNPELYRARDDEDDPDSYPSGHRGRLFFTVHYDHEGEKLQVVIVKVRNLPSRTIGSTTSCDPYVRLAVMPDERRLLQTKQKRKTCNPVFDETFVFQMPARCLAERTLQLTLHDGGRPKKNNILGHVVFPLASLEHDQGATHVLKRDLVKEDEVVTAACELGEVLVSLTFNDSLHRLTITVFEARGFPSSNSEQWTWVKVSLLNQRRVIKTKKTAAVAVTQHDPQYNTSFHFKPPLGMEGAHLSIQLMVGNGPMAKGRLVGRVVIGSFMFARGRALSHWNEVLSIPKEAVQYWHALNE
ncbi:synaptotagmin-15-like [Oratosquilla oratoria]|uniref:synaptotagmin-15-like n=1 Tax=Oratosquilla oratoria TaxID=337810 RepID=UPI003F7671D3